MKLSCYSNTRSLETNEGEARDSNAAARRQKEES